MDEITGPGRREVTVTCLLVAGAAARLQVPGQDELPRWPVRAIMDDTHLGIEDVPGSQFTVTLTETREDGQVFSGFAVDYPGMAAEFIAEVQRYAALGLPTLPDDPAQAAAMRAAGFDVLAEVKELDGPVTVVHVLSEDEDFEHAVSARELAAALGAAASELPGREFVAVMRETPETGPVLSGFRPTPA